jgi:antitoxin (DNA-binding transcriptional repressor) of toxin-antitoxin stability system
LSQDLLTSQERNKSSAFPQGDFAGSRPTTALRPRYESLEGAEVIIARAGKPAVRLAPVRDSEPLRKGGNGREKFESPTISMYCRMMSPYPSGSRTHNAASRSPCLALVVQESWETVEADEKSDPRWQESHRWLNGHHAGHRKPTRPSTPSREVRKLGNAGQSRSSMAPLDRRNWAS